MKAWFDSLAPRERYLLIAGAVIVVVTMFWLFVWQPVATGRAQAAADVERKQLLLVQARRTLTAAPAAAGPSTTGACNQSLTLLVANTVRDAGLGGAYRSSSPFGDDGLRVSLENASFDQAVTWLGRLRAECGIDVESASFTRRPEPGRVDASVTIERSAS